MFGKDLHKCDLYISILIIKPLESMLMKYYLWNSKRERLRHITFSANLQIEGNFIQNQKILNIANVSVWLLLEAESQLGVQV
jgi:hypothetical protein